MAYERRGKKQIGTDTGINKFSKKKDLEKSCNSGTNVRFLTCNETIKQYFLGEFR